jgi:hypothetical protein
VEGSTTFVVEPDALQVQTAMEQPTKPSMALIGRVHNPVSAGTADSRIAR